MTGWDRAVADTDGPQLVVAGPGAGKTEFLVRRALHLIEHGLEVADLQREVTHYSAPSTF